MAVRKAKAKRLKTKKYETAAHLKSDRDVVAYLEAALDEGDAGLLAAALGDVARARGMTKLAKETGLGRESLYKALSVDGRPELHTVIKVLSALNIRLHVKVAA